MMSDPPATPIRATGQLDASRLFAALELGKSRWLVTVDAPGSDKLSGHAVAGGDGAALLNLLARLRATAERRIGRPVQVSVVQEAGLDGFWLHRLLEANGIESHVVDPASIAVNRRHRRAKTDAIDGEKLVRTLMAWARGERRVCSMVRPPSPEEEDRRRLTRERGTLLKERTRHTGIGTELGSLLWLEALFRRFDNRRQLAAYAGLAPSPWQSGGTEREQGISKAGNRRLRHAMVELAWFWLRHQPDSALSAWFRERVGQGRGRVRRIAIVALARKLLVTPWTMLRGAAWATTVIRSGVDAKDDPHLIIVDLDPPDQSADEIAPGGPVRRRQPVPDHPGEALEPADDQLQRSRPGGGIPQRGGLGLELAHALP